MAPVRCGRVAAPRLAALLFAVLVAACSGGGSGSSAFLDGMAAAGVPVAGSAVLVDARGRSSSAAIAADGSFRLDVAGRTAPFLIEVAGTAAGVPQLLHSAATAADVSGKQTVNVTPLTELLTAYTLAAGPGAVFRDPARDLSPLTDEALAAASDQVRGQLSPVLDAFGVVGDLRTAGFAADGTGMDAALDALRLLPVQDASTGAPRYELSLLTGGDPVVIDPAAPSDAALVAFGETELGAVQAALAALADIDTRLQALAALFQGSLPAAEDVAPFLVSSGFKHNGLGLDAWVGDVLLQPRATPDGFDYVGWTLGHPGLVQIAGEDRLRISVQASASNASPWEMDFFVQDSGAGWQIAGNQELAEAGTMSMVRLIARPPTEQEVSDYPGMEVWTDIVVGGVYHDYCYLLPLDTVPQHYFVVGCDGDTTFPLYLVEGDFLTQRAVARDHTHYLGHPSAALEQFLVLYVSSTQLDGAVARVHVTGPGLPAGGLYLVPPNPDFPRTSLILQGDAWNWDAFNTARCANIDPVEDCALDWSAIHTGASYTYDFLDGEGTSLGTAVRRYMGEPHTEAEWLARRDQLFPQFTLSSAEQLTVHNLLRPSYQAGATKSVTWRAPTDPSVSMNYVSLWREFYLGDSGAPADQREEGCSYSLYGKASRSESCTWEADQLTTWAWCDLSARDVWGNEFAQEVSPANPY